MTNEEIPEPLTVKELQALNLPLAFYKNGLAENVLLLKTLFNSDKKIAHILNSHHSDTKEMFKIEGKYHGVDLGKTSNYIENYNWIADQVANPISFQEIKKRSRQFQKRLKVFREKMKGGQR